MSTSTVTNGSTKEGKTEESASAHITEFIPDPDDFIGSSSSSSSSSFQDAPSAPSSNSSNFTESYAEEQMVRRVLFYKNPFDVLDVANNVSIDDIHKVYKKLALILHPDKCKHPKAEAAFSNLNKAYTTIQDEEARKRYTEISSKARELPIKDLEKDKRKLKEAMFEYEVKMKTHRFLVEYEEYARKAEQFRVKNDRFVKDEEQKKKDLQRNKKKKRNNGKREEQKEWTVGEIFNKQKERREKEALVLSNLQSSSCSKNELLNSPY